jgi:polyisoprenyl-phosphate glycosyltransferase
MASISIIIRVDDHTESLKELANQLDKVASESIRNNFEFVYIENGSGDDSYGILQELARTDRRVRVVKLSRNFTDSAAFLAGITYSSGDCLAMIAGDTLISIQAFGEMIANWEMGSKVVIGSYRDNENFRKSSQGIRHRINSLLQKLFDYGASPLIDGCLMIDRQIADIVLRSFEPNTTIQEIVTWSGYQPALVEFAPDVEENRNPRRQASSVLLESVSALTGLSYQPLALSIKISLILAIVGFVIGAGIIGARLLDPGITFDSNILGAILLFTISFELLAGGVAGAYIWRIILVCNKRPAFLVESVINEPTPNPEAREKVEKLLLSLTAGARLRKRGEQ